VFGSRLDDLPGSYERYLVSSIRREPGFGAVSVRLTMRSAKEPVCEGVRGRDANALLRYSRTPPATSALRPQRGH
jgi:hypothetical protein